MIHSMTAFARAEHTDADLSVCIEIRSYNSKYLDISLRMPPGYGPLEERIKTLVSDHAARGRIEIHVKLADTSREALGFDIDAAKADAYHDALKKLKKSLGISGEIPLALISGVPGMITPAEKKIDMDGNWQVLEPCCKTAMADLVLMRRKEGAFLEKDLLARIEMIEAHLSKVETAAQGLTAAYQERLTQRISELTQGQVPLDPSRIAQEAAFLADKSDISEEIIRVKSHIDQFRHIISQDAPAGRKLNFLLQEFNREFNTMGAKVGSADASHLIVGVKSELEKIREQAQNIE